MCLQVGAVHYHHDRPYNYFNPAIVLEPITVFKVIRIYNTSIYEYFAYSPNCTYPYVPLIAWGGEVEKGYHAFTRFTVARHRAYIPAYKAVEFTIPAGAHIFVNSSRTEIVADRIISGSLEPLTKWPSSTPSSKTKRSSRATTSSSGRKVSKRI